MKIAQIAPLFERVPPQLYGGTERIVSYLTEELVRQAGSMLQQGPSSRPLSQRSDPVSPDDVGRGAAAG